MFGYIVPAPEALSQEDRMLFRSFYCSLCREIGKRSQFSRLSLSFDMTFLAILIEALAEKEPVCDRTVRCIVHPLKPTQKLSGKGISYSADMSVILIKAKLDDDARDESNPLYRIASKLIKEDIPNNDSARAAVERSLAALAEIEGNNIKNPDAAADCFAKLCGEMFSLSPVPEKEKKAIYWLGYNLGRWIYLTDAYNDIEHDIKKNSYNPYADGGTADEIRENRGKEITEILKFTLAEAAAAFDLLNVKRYKSLLENIIYIGLPARLAEVEAGKERKNRV
ncbi:MAG: DUF5685 family protein [Clostridia bacterium]|nr:DUF5685 family protein [Clostridia bacterium]